MIPGFVRANDRHVLVVERDSCDLYELYKAEMHDDGTSMFVSGGPEDRWDNDMLALLREIKADDDEGVDVSSLIVDPDSGQVRK